MILHEGSKLVCIGDSITDCDRARPIGEGPSDAYGRGYVSYVNALMQSACPQARIRVVNMGINGNTVRDLKARWKSSVLDLAPDWLSIMIGINDVWRQFDLPTIREAHVAIDEYESTFNELIRSVESRLKGLILITPYFIEPNRNDPMRRAMDSYGAVVKKLAVAHRALLVDVQAAFDEVMRVMHPMELAWDRVHPTSVGHMIIARTFLKTVEFAW